MTVTPEISIADGQLMVHGEPVLKGVSADIVFTRNASLHSGFLGTIFSESKSRHVFPLGVLKGLRFLSCFRFELWWMTQRMGTSGHEIQFETQFMLVEGPSHFYIVFLPLLDGRFRASLQGNEKDELEVCLESGDPAVQTTYGLHSVYVNVGTDPFQVITDAVREVEAHLGTFKHRENKKIPGILDYFGWCTWNAFYTEVTVQGVKQGLIRLAEGGTPARFLILDDGWQSVAADESMTDIASTTVTAGTQLTHFKENHKFQKNGKPGYWPEDPSLGLQHIISDAKVNHNLKYVYVWHALAGYWGGVHPGATGTKHYESGVVYPVHSPGVLQNQPDMSYDSLTINGLGLVNPTKVFDFYNEMHSYLAAAGVDGVKVDVQNIIETLGAGFGGRVLLTQQYHKALEASIARNFPDNGCISSMSHNTDSLYNSNQTAVVRASEDFWPMDPGSHTIHIASVVYNSLFLGQFMQPDWDMFQSLHPAAEYHAAARALGGCAIYVSDKPGHHDFELLKKLVLPDGSVLRAQLPGLPTRDCLFSDPNRDGRSLLKIWNLNKYGGMVGAFNCQGTGWCAVGKKNSVHNPSAAAITGSVCANDIHLLGDVAPRDWDGDCLLYSHRGAELVRVPRGVVLPVTLSQLEYEVFTVVPVKKLGPGLAFAPIGLINMFNAGGALKNLQYYVNAIGTDVHITISMSVHGCGKFGVFASCSPQSCSVDSEYSDFGYEKDTGLVSISLPVPQEGHFLVLRMQFQI